MKELSIEEKAKAYDEAIKKLHEIITMDNKPVIPKEIGEYLFPELKESEDEKIRKALIQLVKKAGEGYENVVNGVSIENAISWLEKQGEKEKFIKKELECIRGYRDEAIRRLNELEQQGEQKRQYISRPKYIGEEELLGEQKPTEWSEEDERTLDKIIVFVSGYADKRVNEYWCNWLKSLRPQNWTKKDKERYISYLQRLGTGNPEHQETINFKWFKEHVYPQTTWKPSPWLNRRVNSESVEYTRTEAFIEKAAQWLDNRGCLYMQYSEGGTSFNNKQFIEDFKKAMKL